MSTYFKVRILIKQSTLIINYFNISKYNIDSVNDYSDYLFLKTVLNYEEIVENIKNDEERLILNNLVAFSKNQLTKYVDSEVPIYKIINIHYKDLLSSSINSDHSIKHITLDYIFS